MEQTLTSKNVDVELDKLLETIEEMNKEVDNMRKELEKQIEQDGKQL
jgi:hypothetical protein